MHSILKNIVLARSSNLQYYKGVKTSSPRCFSLSCQSNSTPASYTSSLPDSFYNEEQKEIQRTLSKLIDTKINPFGDDWEKEGQAPTHEIVKLLGSNDCLGINKPTEYGGLGLEYKYQAAFLEQLGSINSGGVIASIGVITDMTLPALAKFGSDELKREFLAPTIKGDMVSCIGVSEPAAGSDVAGLKTTAKRVGDDLVINGEKVWISNGMQADWMCLLANTSDGKAHKNKSLICVPLNSTGVTKQAIHKMGLLTNDWAQIFFDDVRVPAKNIIGEEGSGFQYQMKQFQEERLSIALTSLLSCDRVISKTIEYTRERKAFGKSILDNQVVQFRLAELVTELESLRALTYQAVDRYTAGEDVTLLASMVKLKCGRLSRELSDTCLQYWGAMGYSAESMVSRSFRDFRQLSIAGGTDEIMLSVISKIMNLI